MRRLAGRGLATGLVVSLGALFFVAELAAAPAADDHVVELEYRTADFATSRRALLRLVSRFGRLQSLENETGAELTARFLVASPQLAEFMAETGALGQAASERVAPAGQTDAPSIPRGQSLVTFKLAAQPESAAAAPSAWPDFSGALLGLGHFLARLAYVSIWMAPLWLLLGLGLWKRRAIGAAFGDLAGRFVRLVRPASKSLPGD